MYNPGIFVSDAHYCHGCENDDTERAAQYWFWKKIVTYNSNFEKNSDFESTNRLFFHNSDFALLHLKLL